MRIYKYSMDNFAKRLETLRIYRGYKTQAELCRELTISRQHWCNWINNNQYPSLSNIIQLANFFKIDIKYFFLPDATPEMFDPLFVKKYSVIIPEKIQAQLNNLFQVTEDNLLCAVDCTKYPDIRKHLQKIAEDRQFFFIEAKYYQPDSLDNQQEKIVIIADCEKLSSEMVQDIAYEQYPKMQFSIFLFGKNIREILGDYGFSNMFDSIITLNTFSLADFRAIVLQYFSGITEAALLTIKYLTKLNLNKLADLISRIEAIPDFQLTAENLVNLYRGIVK